MSSCDGAAWGAVVQCATQCHSQSHSGYVCYTQSKLENRKQWGMKDGAQQIYISISLSSTRIEGKSPNVLNLKLLFSWKGL